MKKLILAVVMMAAIAMLVSEAHAYSVHTVIKSNGVPYTWTRY